MNIHEHHLVVEDYVCWQSAYLTYLKVSYSFILIAAVGTLGNKTEMSVMELHSSFSVNNYTSKSITALVWQDKNKLQINFHGRRDHACLRRKDI